ncbi:MAG TPA: hypothetical protein VLA72_15410 [Anaerolineales bacterium]|nr:hypothetical protein [Anaerolineales bacterium]
MHLGKPEMVTVEFLSIDNLIKGYFFPSPGNNPIATVLFLQGFPGIEGDELICARLARENVNVLTFNYRGTFGSAGHFSFSNAVVDIGAALQFIRQPQLQNTYSIESNKIVLGGWSFGSGIVFAGAVREPEVRKIFTISGRDFSKEARKIEQEPEYAQEATINLAAIRVPKGPVNYRDGLLSDLVENKETFEIERQIPYLIDRDILLIGGWDDEISAIEDHILPVYRSLSKQGIKVSIEAFQDDHEFSQSKDKITQVIANWLKEE